MRRWRFAANGKLIGDAHKVPVRRLGQRMECGGFVGRCGGFRLQEVLDEDHKFGDRGEFAG